MSGKGWETFPPTALPTGAPSATEVKRILRAVATIILAAFVEEEAVKPSKKASQKTRKKKRRRVAMPKAHSAKKKYAVKAKRTPRSAKKKVKRK